MIILNYIKFVRYIIIIVISVCILDYIEFIIFNFRLITYYKCKDVPHPYCLFLREVSERVNIKLNRLSPVTPHMLHDNLTIELDPYWQPYKEIYKKINGTIRLSINIIRYGVYDTSAYVMKQEDIDNIINDFSVYFEAI